MHRTKLDEIQRQDLMASLAAMSASLCEAFASLTPEEARKPGPHGAFSPVEQVWHLADLERDGFGVRIGRLRAEVDPRLEDFDGARLAQERNYRALSLEAGLRAFDLARAENLATFELLSAQDWLRSGTQDGLGTVSLCDMPVLMHQHDQSHMAEIREWECEHRGE